MRAMALSGKFDLDSFGLHQRAILLGERRVGLGENTLEVIGRQGVELDANRQSALQLRDEVRWLRQMKRARCDEQDVIGLDHAVLRRNGAAFDQRQQIALHAFARNVHTHRFAALRHFVDFVEEYDAGLFDALDRSRS